MSASFHWIAWNSPIGFPNCFRSRAYFRLASRDPCAIPTARAAWRVLPPPQPRRGGGDADPAPVEHRQRLGESRPLLAEEILFWNPAVVEGDRGGVAAAHRSEERRV